MITSNFSNLILGGGLAGQVSFLLSYRISNTQPFQPQSLSELNLKYASNLALSTISALAAHALGNYLGAYFIYGSLLISATVISAIAISTLTVGSGSFKQIKLLILPVSLGIASSSVQLIPWNSVKSSFLRWATP